MLQVTDLLCEYPEAEGKKVRGLVLPSFQLADGEACGVTGPSGSGKTTLFHCLSGLISPTRGKICIDGVTVNGLPEKQRARWRAESLGYVFQEPKLLPFLTIGENVRLSARLSGRSVSAEELQALLRGVDLSGYEDRFPRQLSGGERQRAAFVRAIVRKPRLLLADEPTANLDGRNSDRLLELLLAYQKESGCMLLCASHDPAVQKRFARHLELRKEED